MHGNAAERAPEVRQYLLGSGRVPGELSVEFLAAGEYNENFLVRYSENRSAVFRINYGSQLGLENQIEYEFNVLRAVEPSGVTPAPLFCDPSPAGLPGGALLMEYIPGVPLEYTADLLKASAVFARVHTVAVDNSLIIQDNPVLDIAGECRGLLDRYPDHPMNMERRILERYHEYIMRIGEDRARDFKNESMCIVNTEVNSNNFIVRENRAWLVDWEKAVISYRYQDLGHFLVPTTTLWKTDSIVSGEDRLNFLGRYRDLAGLDIPLEEIHEKTGLLEQTILLRGLSWCYMAWYEYTRTDRGLRNMDTFRKIKQYLGDIEWFLGRDRNKSGGG